jgi:oxalate decarboxylase/phosphoglucose isomerase-like protein (cupin superfamily)
MHPHTWFRQEEGRGRTLQCRQLPGDIVYVPAFWAHAVLNVQTTVAVAAEFYP